ncbi:hypothetical protein EHW61_16895 [Salinivibrio sp. VYel6]|uniref:hypothetical protein n=1 Tax=Salinivibrio sp. VYel6 TaxID=2490493 RepID=UPI00128CD8B5|nr:hypothetical protein [Salinivibrio sp. VYel6]MPX98302.1 hypothetical protein [Salinivibrio sp. VYel6]
MQLYLNYYDGTLSVDERRLSPEESDLPTILFNHQYTPHKVKSMTLEGNSVQGLSEVVGDVSWREKYNFDEVYDEAYSWLLFQLRIQEAIERDDPNEDFGLIDGEVRP